MLEVVGIVIGYRSLILLDYSLNERIDLFSWGLVSLAKLELAVVLYRDVVIPSECGA